MASLGEFFRGIAPTAGQGLGMVAGGLLGGAPAVKAGGSLGGSIGSYLGGLGSQPSKFEQRAGDAQNMVLEKMMERLQGPSPYDFGPVAQRARQNFQEQTVPGIASQFTSPGALNSSAFINALSEGGQGLDRQLADLEGQYKIGAHNLQGQDLGALSGNLNQLMGLQEGRNLREQQGTSQLGSQFENMSQIMGAYQNKQQQQQIDALRDQMKQSGTLGQQQPVMRPGEPSDAENYFRTVMRLLFGVK